MKSVRCDLNPRSVLAQPHTQSPGKVDPFSGQHIHTANPIWTTVAGQRTLTEVLEISGVTISRDSLATLDGIAMLDGTADSANSSNAWPDPFVLEPREKHTRTIILLHGRGSTGEEFAAELFESTFSSGETLRDLAPGYKWIFPTCPPCHSVVFNDELTQWYDIRSLIDPEAQNEIQRPGMKIALIFMRDLILEQAALSPTHNIILGGISQGFTIAALTALTGAPAVCALIGFSSWMPFRSVLEEQLRQDHIAGNDLRLMVAQRLAHELDLATRQPAQSDGLPVFLAHCSDDDTVDVDLGRCLRDVLVQLGYRVTWRESPTGGHWINEPHGLNGLKAFLWRYELLNS